MLARAAATLAVVLLAACAAPAATELRGASQQPATISADATATASPAPPTPSPSPTPEPTPDLAALGQMYLDLVAPFNQAVCDFNRVWEDPNSGRPQLEPVSQSLADAARAWTDGARAIDWPEDTQKAIDALIIANAAQEASIRAALGSTTDDGFFQNINRSFDDSAEGGGPAQLARITLGIEGIPTNACE